MALIEVHVHNHVDTATINQSLATINQKVDELLNGGVSDEDRAKLDKASSDLDKSTKGLEMSVDNNPLPKP